MLVRSHQRWPGRLAIAAALCLVMPGAALAQEYPPASVPSGENKAQQPTAGTAPASPAATEAGTIAQPSAQPEQPLAAMGRSLVGKTIYGRDGEQIADIDNVVRTDNEIQAVLDKIRHRLS